MNRENTPSETTATAVARDTVTQSPPPCEDGIVRGWPIETPAGTMYARHVGWGVLIDNSSNTIPDRHGRPVLTVSGREYLGTFGFADEDDTEPERAYVNRRGGSDPFGNAPPGATAKLVEYAREAARDFRHSYPDLVTDARKREQARRDETAAESVAILDRALAEAKRRRDLIRNGDRDESPYMSDLFDRTRVAS